jgi:hypothetical protein
MAKWLDRDVDMSDEIAEAGSSLKGEKEHLEARRLSSNILPLQGLQMRKSCRGEGM